jgi:hypothetical protein
MRLHEQTHRVAGREMVDGLDPCSEIDDARALQPRLRDP